MGEGRGGGDKGGEEAMEEWKGKRERGERRKIEGGEGDVKRWRGGWTTSFFIAALTLTY